MINGKTICLNMIVKNESGVVLRCLEAVRRIIDYWVIVDTGSTDGTQDLIRNYFVDIPGKLYERPWVDFAHNRNEALQFARNNTDYILFIDADDKFVISDSLFDAQLNLDCYLILLVGGGIIYHRILMINNHPGWFWDGVVHECLINKTKLKGKVLNGIVCEVSQTDGRRSLDRNKYDKDAQILEQELIKHPDQSRTVFYLAQVYRASQKLKEALVYYDKRASMPEDNTEEVYWSLYFCGCIQQDLQMEPTLFIQNFCRAHAKYPTRAESLYRLAFYFNQTGNYILAYLLGKMAVSIPFPSFYVAIEFPVYDHGAAYELARSAFALGFLQEAKQLAKTLLTNQNLPTSYQLVCQKIEAYQE